MFPRPYPILPTERLEEASIRLTFSVLERLLQRWNWMASSHTVEPQTIDIMGEESQAIRESKDGQEPKTMAIQTHQARAGD